MPRDAPDLSVLMPVHATVDPAHLDAALGSVLAQSRAADEVVVVVDGPVGAALDAVLEAYEESLPLVVERLPENRGAAAALDHGLGVARGTWVARADSDDVNRRDRLARQRELLDRSGADVCGAAMQETVAGEVVGTRRMPADHDAIVRRMRTTNPLNHPTVVMRRASAVDAGGYQPLALLEDYDLWARMAAAGARFVNDEEPLVRFRADGMLQRRTDRAARRSERELQRRLVRYGLIGPSRARLNLLLRNLFRALPQPLLAAAYRILFRRADGDAR